MTPAPPARPPESPPCDAFRRLMEARRRALLAEVRAIEEFLGVEAEKPKRERGTRSWHSEDATPYKVA